jgi:hypothetical protein
MRKWGPKTTAVSPGPQGPGTRRPRRFFRTIWASWLQIHVQAILASQTEGSLDSAYHLADRICKVTSLPTTASIFPSTPDNKAGIPERIEELSRQVASLQASQTDSRSQSRDRQRSHCTDCHRSTPDNSWTSHNICWYHWNFGDVAQNCIPPCSRQQKYSRQ